MLDNNLTYDTEQTSFCLQEPENSHKVQVESHPHRQANNRGHVLPEKC